MEGDKQVSNGRSPGETRARNRKTPVLPTGTLTRCERLDGVDRVDGLYGTSRQARWAERILTDLARRYPRGHVPQVRWGVFWIENRNESPPAGASLAEREAQTRASSPVLEPDPGHTAGE